MDYWNRLGWQDRFSRAQFTDRQHQYAGEWGTGTVYTPGFVLNGAEWRGSHEAPGALGQTVGVLTVTGSGSTTFDVTFSPAGLSGEWMAYGALLGNGLTSQVTSGENSGSVLKHEFVALALDRKPLTKGVNGYSASLELSRPPGAKAASFSVAVWITKNGTQKPIQAVGGDLP